MKNIRIILFLIGILLLQSVSFAQVLDLGSLENSVLFTAAGSINDNGASLLIGNVGTDSGTNNGFGNVNGRMENNNAITTLGARDLLSIYHNIDTMSSTTTHGGRLGMGDTLVSGVYNIRSYATIDSVLVLDAHNNDTSLFIIQIEGALSILPYAQIILINGAKASNIFWKVEGSLNIGNHAHLKGTFLSHNGSIDVANLVALEGRLLTTRGSITTRSLSAAIPFIPGHLSGPIPPSMATTNCYSLFSTSGSVSNNGMSVFNGNIGTNLGTVAGFSTSSVTGTLYYSPDTTTAICASDLNNAYAHLHGLSYDIELLHPTLLGYNLSLTPHTYRLNGNTLLTDTLYLDALGNEHAIFVLQVNGSLTSNMQAQIILKNGAQAKNVFWEVAGAVNIAASSLVVGTIIAHNSPIILNQGVVLLGRALAINASITTSSVSVIAAVMPFAGAISGAGRLYIGSTSTLTCSGDHEGIWRTANGAVRVAGGLATGIANGTDTVMYIVTNACGADTAFKVVHVNSGATVCVGDSLTLTDTVTGGSWLSSNTAASISGGVVTGLRAGLDTISYISNGLCGADTATMVITINPLPNAGSISGASILLAGSTMLLSNTATTGIWTSSNIAIATINATGLVTGWAPGIDTIAYIVSNACGTAIARKIITVYILPNAGAISGPSSVCIGSNITMADTSLGGLWSTTTGRTLISSTGVVTGISAGADTIKYTVTTAYGTAIASKAITVYAAPNLLSTLTPPAICDSTLFTYRSVSDTISASHLWYRPAVAGISNIAASGTGDINETLNNTTPNTIAIIYTYTITANGCNSIYNITVSMHPSPMLDGYLKDTICSGAMFSYVASSLTSGTSYTWHRSSVVGISPDTASGSGNISEILTNRLPLAVNVKYDYILEANGCSAQQNVLLLVNPRPTVPVITTTAASPVCVGTLYQNFGVNNPSDSTLYQWSALNAIVWAQSNNGQNALINFPNAGNAQIRLTASFSGSPCLSNDSLSVDINNTGNNYPSLFYFLYHFVCLPNNLDSYQWGYDDVATLEATTLVGEINQDYLEPNPDYEHKYYWVNTSYEGCIQKTYFKLPMNVDTLQEVKDALVQVYPNPASDSLHITINTTLSSELKIVIINALGEKIITLNTTQRKEVLNVASYTPGLYFVVVYKSGEKLAAARFVKDK